MLSTFLRFAVGLYALQTVSAQTPPNFTPAISNHLSVTYGTVAINPAGITIPAPDLQEAPSVSLPGTSTSTYIAIMLDFSVSLNGPSAPNTTLLHWLLGGLSSPNDTTTLTSYQSEIAPYFPPGPPPGQTHTYGIFVYAEPAQVTIPADYLPFFVNLTASPLNPINRIGFNLTSFVAEVGLRGPIAADWFLVGTPNTTTTSLATGSVTASTELTSSGTSAVPRLGSPTSASVAPLATVSRSGATGLTVEMMAVVLMAVGLTFTLPYLAV